MKRKELISITEIESFQILTVTDIRLPPSY